MQLRRRVAVRKALAGQLHRLIAALEGPAGALRGGNAGTASVAVSESKQKSTSTHLGDRVGCGPRDDTRNLRATCAACDSARYQHAAQHAGHRPTQPAARPPARPAAQRPVLPSS